MRTVLKMVVVAGGLISLAGCTAALSPYLSQIGMSALGVLLQGLVSGVTGTAG